MKIGAMNNPYRKIIDEIEFIGRNGFDYIDLTVEKPEAHPEKIEENIREILEKIGEYGLEIIGHTPWYLELGHPYENVRRAFLKEAIKIIGILGKMNAKKTTIHPIPTAFGIYKRKTYREKTIKWMIESLKRIVECAERYGMIIVIENIDGGKNLTLKEYGEIVEETGCFFNLDIGHANLNVKENAASKFIEYFGKRGLLKHVHISDNFGGSMRGGWDLHLPLGAGRIDFKGIVEELKKVGYDETITVEVFSKDREYLLISRDKLRKIWKEIKI
ncbi:MAG: sugar phosphate isomerase/epimerase [archaeon GB-1867-097]|nr:sugar phosphate isomerase/epimerase [Candidatus Culexmicrobium thermophilum]HDO20644.1 sugar phosphate isomerase/epimerase [Candidatus Bathyarchaeota archaeon]